MRKGQGYEEEEEREKRRRGRRGGEGGRLGSGEWWGRQSKGWVLVSVVVDERRRSREEKMLHCVASALGLFRQAFDFPY